MVSTLGGWFTNTKHATRKHRQSRDRISSQKRKPPDIAPTFVDMQRQKKGERTDSNYLWGQIMTPNATRIYACKDCLRSGTVDSHEYSKEWYRPRSTARGATTRSLNCALHELQPFRGTAVMLSGVHERVNFLIQTVVNEKSHLSFINEFYLLTYQWFGDRCSIWAHKAQSEYGSRKTGPPRKKKNGGILITTITGHRHWEHTVTERS